MLGVRHSRGQIAALILINISVALLARLVSMVRQLNKLLCTKLNMGWSADMDHVWILVGRLSVSGVALFGAKSTSQEAHVTLSGAYRYTSRIHRFENLSTQHSMRLLSVA